MLGSYRSLYADWRWCSRHPTWHSQHAPCRMDNAGAAPALVYFKALVYTNITVHCLVGTFRDALAWLLLIIVGLSSLKLHRTGRVECCCMLTNPELSSYCEAY